MPYTHKKERVKDFFSHRHKRILTNPSLISLATVSGVLSTKPQMVKYTDLYLKEIDIITTKSFQVTPNKGNREPIICEIESGSYGNSVGLRNPGMEVAYKDLEELRDAHMFRSFLNVSVSASSIEDFITLVKKFNPIADIIELNFSCPHASSGYGSSIGCSKVISSEYMSEIRKVVGDIDSLIFPKLTPNVDNIGEIASALIASGADGLSLINTVGPDIHISPLSNTPILQNSLGGKGGKSGTWVFERALECVKEVRSAVGEDVPIIGMGGVSTAAELIKMVQSGSDVVGIGSAFGKVHQKEWPEFTNLLKEEAKNILGKKEISSNKSSALVKKERTMDYQKHTVIKREEVSKDIVILTVDGELAYSGGEFVFLWIPGVGEKPFSIAISNPLTFIIKVRGEFSKALFNLAVNDKLYVRGLYGAPVVLDTQKKSLLIAGGTGIAVLPPVAKELNDKGVYVETLVGISEREDETLNIIEKEVARYSNLTLVRDDGVVGRVLTYISPLIEDGANYSAYIVGPSIFMQKAAQILIEGNVNPQHIYLSLELNTMCGIGMCGECACGDRLTCQYGTFVSYDYLIKEAPDLL
jgi:dihydroorotate dehydrogenase (NAD+) catalytic subunit